jgi:hypothetical protein
MLRMACRVCVTAMLGALAATPAFAAGIATVVEVVNGGYRQPPGDRERRAAPSDELVSDEALRTGRDSRIAVKFIDGSELNVESQSEVVLTEYLFDPAAATASGIITLNAGLFHFNSNDVADEGVMLRTPVATIGIRGTEFLVTVADDVTIVDILEGKVEVAPSGGGKAITCEGGQSVLVAGAQSDAMCGDLGSFSTAAAPPAAEDSHESSRNGAGSPDAPDNSSDPGGSPGGNPGGGDPGDPGGGDPGGGDPGNPGGGKSNRSGHGDGTNPGKGHGNGNGGNNNGGTGNPGGKK